MVRLFLVDKGTIQHRRSGESAGTLTLLSVFLSVIFLSLRFSWLTNRFQRGYEDRDNFVILQQVGLDEKKPSTTIRKQILTEAAYENDVTWFVP